MRAVQYGRYLVGFVDDFSREGASLGLQARGFPSGAQQDPFIVPRSPLKLQAAPAARVLHAATASADGPRRPSPGPGCALAMQATETVATTATACSFALDTKLCIFFLALNIIGMIVSID